MKKEHLIYIILLLAGLLLFIGLDEAETAVIARNLLHTGLPCTFDGNNLVTQEWGHDSNAKHIWIHQTWLPHYVTALSFKLFSVNTWAARFPFVLLALLTILLLYRMVLKGTGNINYALLSALSLTLSVTFLLHARQCRYYALLLFLSLAWSYTYWNFLQGKKIHWSVPMLMGTLLFHAQYVQGLIWLIVAGGAGLFYTRRATFPKKGLIALWTGLTIFCLPWMLYARLWEKFQEVGLSSLDKFLQPFVMFAFNLFTLNHFIFPLTLIFIIVIWYRQRTVSPFESYLITSGVFYFILISFNPLYPDIRYLIVLIPIAAMLFSKMTLDIAGKHKIFAGIFLASVICTNIWSMPFWLSAKGLLPAKLEGHYRDLRFDLFDYLQELAVKDQGPVRTTVAFLKTRSHPGQILFVPYEAEPYIFYTQLKIARTLPFSTAPDFIILRGVEWYKCLKWVLVQDKVTKGKHESQQYLWNYHPDKDDARIWSQRKNYIESYLERHGYQKAVLSAPNELWENRPTLLWHRFKAGTSENKITVYFLK
jgi:hypothetical protein